VKPIILIGAGGHCASCVEVVESADEWSIAGLVDTPERLGASLLGYGVIATDLELAALAARFGAALITVGQVGAPGPRRRLFDAARDAGFALPVIVASTSRISRHAAIGDGTIVMHRSFVNAGARIGLNCILNTGSIVEHDSIVGDHGHVSTGVIVNGGCSVGDCVMIGSGAVLLSGVSVAPGCIIGAGAVVTKDIREAGVYVGCPARRKE
jgi:sugar O-acyltransferase (sialic acid O-acetyltransferase NeuD family)